jgi:mono/diheme cytochrome c family protein
VWRLAQGLITLPKLAFVGSLIVAGVSLNPDTAQAKTGEEIFFQSGCNACHTIGGGRLIGPDLLGVSERRSEEWLVKFVQHSQAMVEAGDPVAVALFEEHNKVTMPDQVLTKAEILAVVEYAKTPRIIGTAQPAVPVVYTEEDIVLGQNLFEGSTRLSNGGPACNSCHDVTNDAVIGGGILAKELTTVFSRLGGPGVRAILGSPPFPVMQEAYEDEPLTESEVKALVGFLEQADSEKSLQQPRDYGVGLFASGVVGSGILLGLYSLLWRRRKRSSVNQSIYDRQVKST